jgi:hypothetical protein
VSGDNQAQAKLPPLTPGELAKRGLIKTLDISTYEPNQRVVDGALGLNRATSREAINGPECPQGQSR